jgi:cyclophilin family peptidyl-prolyl cis-trans isomerase
MAKLPPMLMNANLWRILLGGCCAPLLALAFEPTEDGLYAVFDTSAGEIAARLHFETVPGTVANFMRLAQGEQDTLDRSTARVRREPFYDGLTFHRIGAPFGIIGGSPDGSEGGGPGYLLPSELFAGFDYREPGALAMYVPGINSIGSQFFITTQAEALEDEPVLFGRHPVFGRVVEGMGVVETIAGASVQAGGNGDRPVAPVVIHGISFRRQGSAATAFDPRAPAAGVALPQVAPVTVELGWQSPSWHRLEFLRPPWSFHYFFASEDLDHWFELGVRNQSTAPTFTDSAQFAWATVDTAGRRFYRMVRATGLPSQSLNGKTLQILGAGGAEPIRIDFRPGFKGLYYIFDPGSGNWLSGEIANYRVFQPGRIVQVVLQFTNLITVIEGDDILVTQPQQIFLYFDASGTAGTTLVHFLATEPVRDANGNVLLGALPSRNLGGSFGIYDTPTE